MIVITGASSGLGAALARLYGNDREPLLITGRNEQRLTLVAKSIIGDVKAQPADLCDPLAISTLLDTLEQTPDTIIHCAGSGYFGPIEEQGTEAINRLIQNNVTSTIFLLRELVQRYRDQKVNIVIVMSNAAQIPKAGESTYCASKWAVRGLVESVRLELKDSPIKLIAVYPGGMATEFWPTCGKNLDTTEFMSAKEVAGMMKQALTNTRHGFVSDITISRS